MIALSVLTIAAACGFTWAIRRYALSRNVLDVPNERSSHATPTPRGGGLAIVITLLAGVLLLAYQGLLEPAAAWALLGGGLAVAGIGFIDDHRPIKAGTRLLVHFGAVGWVIFCLGGLPPVDFGFGAVNLGWAGTLTAIVFLVWFLNLYNFMDGIDGIASVEALSVAGSAAMLLPHDGSAVGAQAVLLLLAAATAGFLVWNWPPARIFMGDVGSGFLGFVLGTLAVYTVTRGLLTAWVWLILYSVFFVDATLTLFRRMARRERLQEAHRSHAYQWLARRFGAHLPVTLGVLAINVLWLLPLAWAAAAHESAGAALTVLAWTPLAYAAWRLGAGRREGAPRSAVY